MEKEEIISNSQIDKINIFHKTDLYSISSTLLTIFEMMLPELEISVLKRA